MPIYQAFPKIYAEDLTASALCLDRCGDPNLTMSEERNFTTPPAPGSDVYPQRLTVVADLGQTHNSSLTLQHIVASGPKVTPDSQHHPLHSLLCGACSTIQGPSSAPAAEELSHVPQSMLRACMQHHASMSAQLA